MPMFLSQSTSLARVTWVDASTSGGPGWVDQEDAAEFAQQPPPVMSTVGYVLAQDDEGPEGWIVLTDTLGQNECSSVHKIPNSMVIKLEIL